MSSEIQNHLLILIEDVIDCRNKITNQKGGLEGFADWVIGKNDLRGVKKTSLHNLVGDLKRMVVLLNKDSFADSFNLNTNSFVKKAELFVSYVEEYLAKIGGSSFAPRIWYFYFLDVGDTNRDYPKLGRGLLSTTKDNKAVLKIPDRYDDDYTGDFNYIGDNVIFFDMWGNERKKRLHIKINFRQAEDDIMVGSYSTFDRRIYTGSLVLEQLTNEFVDLNELEPTFLSKVDNPQDFKEVKSAIKEYLAVKKQNHHKVPRMPAIDIDGLSRFLNAYPKPQPKNIEDRFLELESPIVFISAPQTSIKGDSKMVKAKKKVIKGILDDLKTELEKHDEYQVKYEDTDIQESYKMMKPFDCLRMLERTRFFILILTETEKASFSLIQLGWAIGLCKNVLFIYEGDIVSERLKSLEAINSNFIPKNRKDIIKQRNRIYRDIVSYIYAKRFDLGENHIK